MPAGTAKRTAILPENGTTVWIGGCGVTFKVAGEETGGAFSVVEHPVLPKSLIPPHVHQDEDELSIVVDGVFGVMIGDEVIEAGPGSYVFKPRGIPHAFWNAGDETARLIELIYPAGFERFFEELGSAFEAAAGPPDPDFIADLSRRYHVPYLMELVADLEAKYGVSVLHSGGTEESAGDRQ